MGFFRGFWIKNGHKIGHKIDKKWIKNGHKIDHKSDNKL
jgi:hypothetical protein